ncbi:hypothetical protein [Actinomadura rupiterrae]|uniref:hypothetical protein n=1 Tax=Actinomadura rupiterrae TaxID=559627 RepID=UPI0020A415EE|nr:hypothetical protein [Actinomadura rupiterrae]MCP2341097.1 hypothetical protein [Actinomadura rupiterrae]
MAASVRRSLTGAAVVGAAALAWTAAAPAGARPARAEPLPAAPVLPITVTSAGFEFPGPNPRPAGPVTLRVTTPDAWGHFLGTGSIREGVPLQQAMTEFAQSQSPDKAVAIPALRALYRDVEFFGGAGVFPATSPVSVTVNLRPGTYYGIEGANMRRLDVGQTWLRARPPRVDGLIRMVQRGPDTRFALPSRLKARGSYLVVNQTSQPQEAVFVGLDPATTDADIQRYYDDLAAGKNPQNPLLHQVGGLMAISPGYRAVLNFDYPPGRYAVLSFYRDPDTAVKRAAEGMHRVVELR